MLKTKIQILGLIFATCFYYYGCSCSCGAEQNVIIDDQFIKLPAKIRENADRYLMSRTGSEFFDAYITFDGSKTTFQEPLYRVEYTWLNSEKPDFTGTIVFFIDTAGTVSNMIEPEGIPLCNYAPEDCLFKISSEEAKQKALEAGIKTAERPLIAKFEWNPSKSRYLWSVVSVLYESQGSQGFRGNGQEALIDPGTGAVISIKDWKVN